MTQQAAYYLLAFYISPPLDTLLTPSLPPSLPPSLHPCLRLWLARNPYTSTHVFISDVPSLLLPKLRTFATKHPHATLLLVLPPALPPSLPPSLTKELSALGVVVMRERVEKVDAKRGMVLLEGGGGEGREGGRMVEFDSLTVEWRGDEGEGGRGGGEDGWGGEEAVVNPNEEEEEEEEKEEGREGEKAKVVATSAVAVAVVPAAAVGVPRRRRREAGLETQVFFPDRYPTSLPLPPSSPPPPKQIRAFSAVPFPPPSPPRTPSSSSLPSSSSSSSSSPCDGCSRIVKGKTLGGGREGGRGGGGGSLHTMVTAARLSRTDTWPWVWLARDPERKGGKVHVVLASGEDALREGGREGGGEGGVNVVVVGRKGGREEGVAVVEEMEGRGWAWVEGGVEEVEVGEGIVVMLRDERLIEADSLKVIYREGGREVGR